MSSAVAPGTDRFDPAAFQTFRFLSRRLDPDGTVTLGYGLDDAYVFTERFVLPAPDPARTREPGVRNLLALLHWVSGVSYYKLAAPPRVACESGAPWPAAAALLEALYSEGLGEYAVVNRLAHLPRPAFGADGQPERTPHAAVPPPTPRRVLVPVGGGKDSIVAIEAVRRAGLETALFSVGDAAPIARTAAVAGLPRLIATRTLDPRLGELNRAGARNGHVPITAIVSLVAALTAALHGFDTVAFANERSASQANLEFDGVEVNHQFSKGRRAERLLADALAPTGAGVRVLSVLRPAAELSIARAFARLGDYHAAFTSCNRVFRLDPGRRASAWCGECDKCRFVYLILAPFLDRSALVSIFGRDLLEEPAQLPGFARLTATGGHKPFECVGEVEEAVAAIRLLAEDPRWREAAVARALAGDVLPRFPDGFGRPAEVLALGEDHSIPAPLIDAVRALLGA